jgi:hypothetical protein
VDTSTHNELFSVGGTRNAKALLSNRRRIRSLANSLSAVGKIKERPGIQWRFEFGTNSVIWRATWPWPPYDNLTQDEVIVAVAHEMGHANYTGGFPWPDEIPQEFRGSFARFVSFVEDIRVDRYMRRDFAGKVPSKVSSTSKLHSHLVSCGAFSEMAFHDQLWTNYFGMEYGIRPHGVPEVVEFTEATWPTVTKLGNASSTADVAKGIVPIFMELLNAAMEMRTPDHTLVDMDAVAAHGHDSPDKHQFRSEWPDDDDGMQFIPLPHEIMEGMRKDMRDGSQATVLWDRYTDKVAEENAQYIAESNGIAVVDVDRTDYDKLPDRIWDDVDQTAYSHAANAYLEGIGTVKGRSKAWQESKDRVDPQMRALTRRLQAALRTNEQDDFLTGQRRGSLDTGIAYKSTQGNVNVFQDRLDVGTFDYTFGLLVDVSSSQYHRRKALLDSAVLFSETVEAAGLGLFVIPWSTMPGEPKPLGRKLDRYKRHLAQAIGEPSGGTFESPALAMAIQEFEKCKPSTSKVMITITDGATSDKQQSVDLLSELTSSGVSCIGIGVGCPAPDHYPTQLGAEGAQELAALLPQILRQTIVKGH